MEVEDWDPSLAEELGVSLDELKKWIENEVERSEAVQQRKTKLAELKEWVEQKEKEEAVVDTLLKSIAECETLVKQAYRKVGLTYRESSSDDDGGGGAETSEVIEIDDDEDDDVIAVDCLVPPMQPATPIKDTAFKDASAAPQRTSHHMQKLSQTVNKLVNTTRPETQPVQPGGVHPPLPMPAVFVSQAPTNTPTQPNPNLKD